MKKRFGVWLVLGMVFLFSRLAAQDVIVTDPAWIDPENPPADELPSFKKRPNPEYPKELKTSGKAGYVLHIQHVNTKGKNEGGNILGTNPYFEKLENLKYRPARENGKPVDVFCWFSAIYNPASSDVKAGSRPPRLKAVAPVFVDKGDVPKGTELPLTLNATISLDETGAFLKFALKDAQYEFLRPHIERALKRWEFIPGREGGRDTAADLEVPFIICQRPDLKGGKDAKPPKLVKSVRPVYPMPMRRSGLRGEVEVAFVVDEQGDVINPFISRSSDPGFDDAAIEAVLQWKFRPATMDGKPTKTKMRVPVVFEILHEGGFVGENRVRVRSSKKNQAQLPKNLRSDTPPQPQGIVVPVYPYELLRAGQTGSATLALMVDARGDVGAIEVLASTSSEFTGAMIAAVERFHFTPAVKGGEPTPAPLKIEQKFDLSDAAGVVSAEDRALLNQEESQPESIASPKNLDAPIKPLSMLPPKFPTALVGRRDHGHAVVEALVDEAGRARLPRLVEASDPAFGYAAVQAMAGWRFEPATSKGKPTVFRVRVPFAFKPAEVETNAAEASEPPRSETEAKLNASGSQSG